MIPNLEYETDRAANAAEEYQIAAHRHDERAGTLFEIAFERLDAANRRVDPLRVKYSDPEEREIYNDCLFYQEDIHRTLINTRWPGFYRNRII